jgi:BirA family biotin operon repressor/biotin-[acetyl-CoA-carboxylase] ligase
MAIDEFTIRSLLIDAGIAGVDSLHVFGEIDSTNTFLSGHVPPAPGRSRIAVADHQTAGRGRGGNAWISAPQRSLCLSLAYTFTRPPPQLSALTLALGVSVAELLVSLGGGNVGLKWPNDILVDGAKLGGILTESRYDRSAGLSVVAGIGVNFELPDDIDSATDLPRPPTDMRSVLGNPPPREAFAVAILQAWSRVLGGYLDDGFSPYLQRFRALDWLAGQSLTVDTGSGNVRGIASGVDNAGALLVKTDEGFLDVMSGSVTCVGHS